ncbi:MULTISPECIES: hypothetical protein [unclassified Psychrobacter]|uniref:hypothetical protein n=1 Tax=unclassified Psychrobacter TaxID=196806 RepID=UPI00071E95E1|nr:MULTISPECIES: hypothetical protein [unclassified Psychrobacter]OLF39507.1 hypothetical protein BTV98_03695 [Psychrobacter sp. Cmf 22.2]
MYYIGASPPKHTPIETQPLSWSAGSITKDFTFIEATGNKTFNINFPLAVDLNNDYGQPPFYGSVSGVTSSALNLSHNSTSAKTNHILNISINRSVSKTGYKIQDLDSTKVNYYFFSFTPYIEQVDVSTNNGKLTFNSIFQTINTNNNIVTAKEGENCGVGECNIDTSWNYNLANTALSLKHNNTKREINGVHIVGYSDFYFCLAPPKLVVQKALNGNRINDTDSKRDQFEIKVTGGSIASNNFTTAGTGTTIANGSSNVIDLAESTTYTITERVMNGTTLGDIANYNATYNCTNATTNGTTIPTTAMKYDATTKTRSFTISGTTYGDEITCTITNGPASYTFSGTVFNDNGGITDAQADIRNAIIDSGTYNNSLYFNGLFDTTETGIADSTVSLVNCTNTTTVYATKAVEQSGSNIGKYQITVPNTTLAGIGSVCLIESNSNTSPAYPIRTTTEKRSITLIANNYSYSNNDFGRVITNNAALVLEKEQAANDCKLTNFVSLTYSKNPLSSSATGVGTDIRPGQCIAYKITATNRANIAIRNFVMQDILQRKDPSNPADSTVTSVLAAPDRAAGVFSDGLSNGQNGTIKTVSATLPKREKRIFYFNTQYGSTQSK